MSPENSFAGLMARLQAGDEEAAAQVFHRFAGRLIALARGRLDPLVRQKVGPEDVVQSVFRSFFRCQAEGRWDLAGWDRLWVLLLVLTVRKCGRQATRYRAARRDVRREETPGNAGDSSATEWENLAREPTPDEAAMLDETLQQLLGALSPRDRQIVVLTLQGHAVAEVAREVRCTVRTVQRILQRLREHLERQANAEEERPVS
jgi:RNA polymerase sigma-70 factor (ECF subfamily)